MFERLKALLSSKNNPQQSPTPELESGLKIRSIRSRLGQPKLRLIARQPASRKKKWLEKMTQPSNAGLTACLTEQRVERRHSML